MPARPPDDPDNVAHEQEGKGDEGKGGPGRHLLVGGQKSWRRLARTWIVTDKAAPYYRRASYTTRGSHHATSN
jgi:hypothetical protein